MPKEIEAEEIRARYKNGVLDVYLPAVEDGGEGHGNPDRNLTTPAG